MSRQTIIGWASWLFLGLSVVMMLFTDFPAFPFAILGLTCGVIARVERLEKRLDALSVRHEQISQLDP